MGRCSRRYAQVSPCQRWLEPLLVLLLVLAPWRSAAAQSSSDYVDTAAGVAVAVPAGLRAVAGLGGLPGGPAQISGVATFSDGQPHPVTVHIQEGEGPGLTSLPAAGDDIGGEWARTVAARLGVPEAFDFVPGGYDPGRSALSLRYKVRGPSRARLLTSLPSTHPLWATAARGGLDVEPARCVLSKLLAGAASAKDADLEANVGVAANACGLTEAVVGGFLAGLDPAAFAPSLTTMTVVVFFTRVGSVVTTVLAPLDRQAAVDETAAVVWERTRVAASVRLPVEPARGKTFEYAQLAGIVLGALLAVFVLGGGLSWVLTRLGVRLRHAVLASLGLLVALALLGLVFARELTLQGGLQAVCYALASGLAFRPLVRWLSAGGAGPGGIWPLRADQRGLSTVEYVILVVLVAAIGIGVWKTFGSNVQSGLARADHRLQRMSESDLDGPAGSASPGAPAASASQGLSDGLTGGVPPSAAALAGNSAQPTNGIAPAGAGAASPPRGAGPSGTRASGTTGSGSTPAASARSPRAPGNAASTPAAAATHAGPPPPPPASPPRDPVPVSVVRHPAPPPPPPPEPKGLSEVTAGAIGFGLGVLQGSAPGGFLTSYLPVPEQLARSRAYQYWNGAGQVITGVTQMVSGVGGEIIGTGADATGVGAIVGVPINVASAAVIANGLGATGTGLAQMAAASRRAPTEPNPSGETSATAKGKEVHAERAAERRASGEWDEVNQRMRDANGETIEVPRRVDPKTGEPVGTRTQTAQPDAVSYKRGQILDDKPLGRPIAKDRQEIVRFIKAYEERTGELPKQIIIERYDPKTGAKVLSEVYKPQDFLP